MRPTKSIKIPSWISVEISKNRYFSHSIPMFVHLLTIRGTSSGIESTAFFIVAASIMDASTKKPPGFSRIFRPQKKTYKDVLNCVMIELPICGHSNSVKSGNSMMTRSLEIEASFKSQNLSMEIFHCRTLDPIPHWSMDRALQVRSFKMALMTHLGVQTSYWNHIIDWRISAPPNSSTAHLCYLI